MVELENCWLEVAYEINSELFEKSDKAFGERNQDYWSPLSMVTTGDYVAIEYFGRTLVSFEDIEIENEDRDITAEEIKRNVMERLKQIWSELNMLFGEGVTSVKT